MQVQCGLGRTGAAFWAFEAQGVAPDILVAGKALGAGFPIAAVLCTVAVAEAFAAGPDYFNTFAASNAACASGLAVLAVHDRLRLQQRASAVGDRLLCGLRALQAEWPDDIGDVRGAGLFIGVEFVVSAQFKQPAPAKAAWFKEAMKERKVPRLNLLFVALIGPRGRRPAFL